MTIPRRPTHSALTHIFRDGVWAEGVRDVIDETAIAIVVDGGAEAVMMATHADLEDFVIGFALSEGLIAGLDEIRDLELAEMALGVEARLWLREPASSKQAARRRRRMGPAGCGLCGVESLEEARREFAPIHSAIEVNASEIVRAMGALSASQPLNAATRAAHAAALYFPETGVALVREDIGRHNALDKLIGALAQANRSAAQSAILITSRLSIELVQKAAFARAPVLAAISAPSALAIAAADKAGITLCGIVRENGLEVFTHAQRIV